MSISYLYKKRKISKRIFEEELYAQVLREVEQGIRRDGLWAMALEKSGGDPDMAKSSYIGLRVQALRDEVLLYEMELSSRGSDQGDTTAKNTTNIWHDDADQGARSERERRISDHLRKELGREPTETEITKAKWEGVCL